MKLPVIFYCLLVALHQTYQSPLPDELQSLLGAGLNSSLASKSVNESSNQQSARLLTLPSAPYAIGDMDTPTPPTVVLNILASNGKPSEDYIQRETNSSDSDQHFIISASSNSTNFDLRSLIETLDKDNLTSEVHFDDSSPGLVNITITKQGNQTIDQIRDGVASKLLFRGLLDGAKFPHITFNMSSVMKNEHRYTSRPATRSKPSSLSIETMTALPIRRTPDVAAENYTTKDIAKEINIFGLRVLNQLNLERLGAENIINGPFAIYQSLSLLMAGAMGDTSRELDKLLLGAHSVYDNSKLTHDQDRSRLITSFNYAVRQLYESSMDRQPGEISQVSDMNCTLSDENLTRAELDCSVGQTSDETEDDPDSQVSGQRFIVANNLLFSPNSYEISNEFRQTLTAFYNNTALTKIEVGSTESVQVVNEWIRRATAGLIPAILNRKSTFDEFNVMTLLSTSWLSLEWLGSFKRISSSLRASIRLKGQASSATPEPEGLQIPSFGGRDEPLMEFTDDQRGSHFVDYIRSEPTRYILNYHTILNRQRVNVVVVPFAGSNQRLITISPDGPVELGAKWQARARANSLTNRTDASWPDIDSSGPAGEQQVPQSGAGTDRSSLTKLIGALAMDPARAMRSLWATIAPDLITKQTLMSLQLAKQRTNSTNGSQIIKEFSIPPKTQLSMPLIRLEAGSTLNAPLNHIGLVNSFDPAQANFIGLNGHPFNYNKLHLSNVLYKTTFNLNENGVNYDRTVKSLESLRITTQKRQRKFRLKEKELESGELVNEVKLDKPFILMVADIKTRLVLYSGTVRNPAREDSSLSQ